MKATAAAHSSPIVCIAGPEPHLIKRALGAGAHGIMIPIVETQAQVELIARVAHYPDPASGFASGTRGIGGLFASLSWGIGTEYDKYSTSVNEKLVVIVHIKMPLGVANCQEIEAVEGIDALFIGPNDWCASMGFLGRNHADMREVLKAAKEVGKFAGYFCLSAELATELMKKGWEIVNCAADIVAVMAWMGSEMKKFKKMTRDLT
ncbi:Pyruvate/Phosphoenolpyruvate kinase-like domain-containing protein [Ilyonectria sp. MPI-CAGE-AT-0026]|nr:Pyruvate/Phosphoenolpyruvate kinase-like domain-containing protein [Ilyonectria sp. MPI-CAGE-AT-0026]